MSSGPWSIGARVTNGVNLMVGGNFVSSGTATVTYIFSATGPDEYLQADFTLATTPYSFPATLVAGVGFVHEMDVPAFNGRTGTFFVDHSNYGRVYSEAFSIGSSGSGDGLDIQLNPGG